MLEILYSELCEVGLTGVVIQGIGWLCVFVLIGLPVFFLYIGSTLAYAGLRQKVEDIRNRNTI